MVSSDTSNFVVVNTHKTPTTFSSFLPGGNGDARFALRAYPEYTEPMRRQGVPYISTVTITDRFYNTKTDVTPQIQI